MSYFSFIFIIKATGHCVVIIPTNHLYFIFLINLTAKFNQKRRFSAPNFCRGHRSYTDIMNFSSIQNKNQH
jgi:hypothetical protein